MLPNAANHMIMPPPKFHSPEMISEAMAVPAELKNVAVGNPRFLSQTLNSPNPW